MLVVELCQRLLVSLLVDRVASRKRLADGVHVADGWKHAVAHRLDVVLNTLEHVVTPEINNTTHTVSANLCMVS